METLGKMFYALISVALASLVNSYVIQKLWTWILIPVFNVSPITMGAAFGLSVIVAFVRYRNTEEKDGSVIEEITKSLIRVFLSSGLYLLMGWVASMFV